jgi:hypothetical protein
MSTFVEFLLGIFPLPLVGQQPAQFLVADGFPEFVPDLTAQCNAAPQVPLRRG